MGIVPMIIIGVVVIFFIVFIILILIGTSQKGLEKTLTKQMNILTRAQNNVLKNNEEILRENANKQAEINKDAIRTTAEAIKEGFSKGDMTFCKHCGSSIDADSKFCKICGKEQ